MCSSIVWTNCNKEYLDRVFRLQKRAVTARVILDAPYMLPTIQLFIKLHWFPFYEEVKVNKCALAFKSVNGEIAPYLCEILKLNRELHSRNVRYANVNFICPWYSRKTEGDRTFGVTTIKLWNSLLLDLRWQPSARIFRDKYVKL